MKYFRNFLIAVTIVFIGMALGNAALAAHSPTTTGSWLVVIDWDEHGQPSQNFIPVRLGNRGQCSRMAPSMVNYLAVFEPDRLYVMACVHPDDEMDLDAVIETIIKDYRPYFQPGQGI